MNQPEQTHYYLIEDSIMKGGEMPTMSNFPPNEFGKNDCHDAKRNWQASLTPCQISPTDLEQIKSYYQTTLLRNEPIDCSEVIESYSTCYGRCDGVHDECDGKEMYRFKEPKSESNEVDLQNEFRDFCKFIPDRNLGNSATRNAILNFFKTQNNKR